MKRMNFLLAAVFATITSEAAFSATITPQIPELDTTDLCYQITNAAELYGFAEVVKGGGEVDPSTFACGKLMDDITVNTNVLKTAEKKSNVSDNGLYIGDTARLNSWVPIGTKAHPFTGSFRGQGHTIKGLFFNDTASVVGLFGYVANDEHPVIIDGLGIEDAYIRGKNSVAGFVAFATDTLMFSNVHFSGVLHSNGDYGYANVGSFVGYIQDSCALQIVDSYSNGSVFGAENVGGFVGFSYSPTKISGSYSKMEIMAKAYVGGLIGMANNTLKVEKSYFKGRVDASSYYVGGLAGYASIDVTIADSYAEGDVITTSTVGGLVGSAMAKTLVENSYFKGKLKGGMGSGGLVGEAASGSRSDDSVWIINSHAESDTFEVAGKFGGLVGNMHGPYLGIKGSYVKGDIVGNSCIGGLVGEAGKRIEIDDSYYEGDLIGDSLAYDVGGLVGASFAPVIVSNSHVNGKIVGEDYVGGLIGYGGDTNKFVNSYYRGFVDGGRYDIGGFVGHGGYPVIIINSFSSGAVKGEDLVGGFIGYLGGKTTIINSHTTMSTSGETNVGPLVGSYLGCDSEVWNVYYPYKKEYVEADEKRDSMCTEPGVHFYSKMKLKAVLPDEFANGSVTLQLRNFESEDGSINGDIWGQRLFGKDPDQYPVFASVYVFPIIADLNGGAVEEDIKDSYEYGTKYTFPIPTREHYDFKGWYKDPEFVEGSEISGIESSTAEILYIYAKWDPQQFKIEVAVNDSTMGSVEGAGSYDYGSEATLKAIAKTGYQFSDWADDAKAPAERKITVTEGKTYTANFKAVPVSSSSSSKKATSSSSSSAKAKSSSSSSKKGGKSSSSGKDAIVASAQLPQFSVTVANRLVQVDGIVAGTRVTLLDMQGRVLAENVASASSFSMVAPRTGTCLLRVGSVTRTVHVK